MKIGKNSKVKIHYTLTSDQGDVIDSTAGGEPLDYEHGVGMIIPGLEAALEGASVGAKIKVRVEPEEGYGEREEGAVYTLPIEGFQPENNEELILGMHVEIETEGGPALAIVTKIEEKTVDLDLNHPLAGLFLNFDVEVIEVL